MIGVIVTDSTLLVVGGSVFYRVLAAPNASGQNRACNEAGLLVGGKKGIAERGSCPHFSAL